MVACARKWCAVATSKGYLRIFTAHGDKPLYGAMPRWSSSFLRPSCQPQQGDWLCPSPPLWMCLSAFPCDTCWGTGGLQKMIFSLPGPIVSMVGHGQRLVLVYHGVQPIKGQVHTGGACSGGLHASTPHPFFQPAPPPEP